jgi:D-alanyl-D-alanine-carboxypeptidase/D-alanyl-D-alanine-endopeptidase
MQFRQDLAALFAVMTLLAISPASSSEASEQNFRADVDVLVTRFMKSGEVVGLEIGVIRKRDQPQLFAYGEVVKGSGQKPTPSTLFQIGSITKTFTGILLALLVERGMVQLNDPLQKYMPKGVEVPSYNGRQILLLDLATHVSALPRNPPMAKRQPRLTVDEMYELLRNLRLTRQPGRQYEYSNWGFGLLGDALVRVTKAADYEMLYNRV